MKSPSAAVVAAAKSRQLAQSPDRLRLLRDKVREARDLRLEIVSVEEKLQELQKRLLRILGGGQEPGELVGLLEELGVTSISLEREGNAPAYEAELGVFYSASIPKDAEKAAAALDHIERVWRMPDLVKTSISADFGRGERKAALALEKFMKKSNVEFTSSVGVNSQTLKAEIRRRFESGRPLSPKELSTVGAFVGTIVKLSERKKED